MLSITKLSHVYANGTRALDDVSLHIPRGMFGLLGPNGAGKSTLMRCIATLQSPTSGTIAFGDVDVIRQPVGLVLTVLARLLKPVGPQGLALYSRISPPGDRVAFASPGMEAMFLDDLNRAAARGWSSRTPSPRCHSASGSSAVTTTLSPSNWKRPPSRPRP